MEASELDPWNLRVGSYGWMKLRLRRAGLFLLNYAALLCLIDCIVLPALITLFRLLDMFQNFHAYENVVHVVEIACVIPLGLLSVFVNYRKSKRRRYLAQGLCGIVLVVCGHQLVEGWYDTALSLTGCALLVSSNHFASRESGCHNCHHSHLPVVA
ncbi:hypothetical protein, conserved [Babesia bigemina]|uniref:MerC domain-containing protein n=1 Tax=Babesia bigemina TaxID=5866 RepID=A0A061D8U2_BABBI|nr:hypothetical protein, conserved [Babesia bigemina]CDR97131.1 hypothetical protein, conserved [Babesia bigemina]|eukprot:XP_012769317.1 hypothetical protein, conserved [Babesia bigemina]